ncbi:ATP synthase subunit b, mitochondrial [Cylas formicarius]|uniref:ATP synthase subunit b, mitochondrial n=1 Tax=Cylas formicarius TaxID=197179 RepID=UPI00295858EC|nr:ATP synthase subunit b, mitochondrial [Cylas formicarius]
MLSRAILSGQNSRALLAFSSRATSTSVTNSTLAKVDENKPAENIRLVRQEPGKVRCGFIPDEWFQFFYKKTGVTGPYTFVFTLSTYLVSKEIYVMDHDFYNGLGLLVMWIYGIKKFGPKVAEYLDKEVDSYEKNWNQSRIDEKDALQGGIDNEQKAQWSMEGQNLLIEAKRENVGLQLEATYRQRLIDAYSEVKKRLDYQVEKNNSEKRISQKNLVEYVVARVKASITADQEKQNLNKCISDLAALAKA